MVNKLTERNYWDSVYANRDKIPSIILEGYKNHCVREIYRVKERHLSTAQTVLEIGGGGSSWILYLAEKFPDKQFAVLDYSEKGCELLSNNLKARGIANCDVWVEDFFHTSKGVEKFDFVYSHGVVEHFEDLSSVLRAHGRFLKKNGIMLTIIPNMAGILGLFTKWLNRSVYDIHVRHDLASFKQGHCEAGLEIIESGYLCSHNFSVLSSCVSPGDGWKWELYKALSRLSKAIWFFEDKLFSLPATKLISPYIYVVSKKTNGYS